MESVPKLKHVASMTFDASRKLVARLSQSRCQRKDVALTILLLWLCAEASECAAHITQWRKDSATCAAMIQDANAMLSTDLSDECLATIESRGFDGTFQRRNLSALQRWAQEYKSQKTAVERRHDKYDWQGSDRRLAEAEWTWLDTNSASDRHRIWIALERIYRPRYLARHEAQLRNVLYLLEKLPQTHSVRPRATRIFASLEIDVHSQVVGISDAQAKTWLADYSDHPIALEVLDTQQDLGELTREQKQKIALKKVRSSEALFGENSRVHLHYKRRYAYTLYDNAQYETSVEILNDYLHYHCSLDSIRAHVIHTIGLARMKQGRYEEALPALARAVVIYESLEKTILSKEVVADYVDAAMKADMPEKARGFLALRTSDQSSIPRKLSFNQPYKLIKLGMTREYEARGIIGFKGRFGMTPEETRKIATAHQVKGNLAQAVQAMGLAVDQLLAQRGQNSHLTAQYQAHLAQLQLELGLVNEAKRNAASSFKTFVNLHHTEDAVGACSRLGDIEALRRQYVRALDHFARAQGFESANAPPASKYCLLVRSAQRFSELKNYQVALTILREALAYARRENAGPEEIAALYLELGQTALKSDDIPVARRWFRLYYDQAQRHPDMGPESLARARRYLAEAAFQLGDIPTARASLKGLAGEDNGPVINADVSYLLVKLHETVGDTAALLVEAERCIQLTSALPPEDQPLQYSQRVLEVQTLVAMQLEDFPKALEYLRLQTINWDSQPDRGRLQGALARYRLAQVYIHLGHVALARQNLSRILESYRLSDQEAHQLALKVNRDRGTLSWSIREFDQARADFTETLRIQLRRGRNVALALSEAEILAFAANTQNDLGPLLMTFDANSATDTSEAYDWVQQEAAVTWLALRRRIDFARQSQIADRLFEDLKIVKRRLARSAYQLPPDEAGQESPDELSVEKERLEREIAKMFSPPETEKKIAETPREIFERRLPPDVTIVHFVRTDELALGATSTLPTRTPVYHAFVLQRESVDAACRVQWLRLGDAAVIDDAVEQWRHSLLRQRSVLAKLPRGLRYVAANGVRVQGQPDVRFRHLVWQKLAPHVADKGTLIVVPSGSLHRVPWAALPLDDSGQYLIHRYTLATSINANHIASLLERHPVPGEAFVAVGGLNYNREGQSIAEQNSPWPFLPGTLAETDILTAMAPKNLPAISLTGGNGTEAQLRTLLPQARFIHLATHGFFSSHNRRLPHASVSDTASQRNPLLWSGVVLSGANDTRSTDHLNDDGLLTAEEVVDSDLSGTELVVLSGCETGLGNVAGGEAIYGLQRAFALAGARSSLSSLWRVEDEPTMAIMAEFYRNLWVRRMSKSEALRAAQLAMLEGSLPTTLPQTPKSANDLRRLVPKSESRGPAPAYHWAGWTLCGDWN